MSANNEIDFFVGYLPMPTSLSGFYRIIIPSIVLLALGFSVWVALSQKSAGEGQWDTSRLTTLEGVLTIDPYPVLHLAGEGSKGKGRSVLLVVQGKHSAEGISRSWSGKYVSVSGFAISRGNWEMLEIRNEQDITLPGSEIRPELRIPNNVNLGNIELTGEIVDSKCFLGVMKPGRGKVHSVCAELCLLGGIPPMFVAEDLHGNKAAYLLVSEDGDGVKRSASKQVSRINGVPVSLRGQLERRGDLLFITVDERGISAVDFGI
jgi:hypothetical protein